MPTKAISRIKNGLAEKVQITYIEFEDLKKEKMIFPNLIEIIPKIINSKEVLIQETNRYKDEEGNFISYEINSKNKF